ncbi:MAG TPA: phasin family protein [Burkholderiaceae bacterium]|nr:phasin family protein [Burkholderiaceae bacterium]
MATKSSSANPIATFYEAQTAATAEIVQAALDGMQRLQKLTLEAMRAGAGGQFSLAQSMATMRDGGNLGRSISDAAAPAAEQGTRYQREMVQAIAEMNNNVLRASYSMMERMRDAFETVTQGAIPMGSPMPGLSMTPNESVTAPMAMVDSAMRQWHTAVQQMMETPAAAMTVAPPEQDRPRASSGSTARKSKRAAKRKSRAAR